mmetsp:Transcript_21679/g.32138  ORF Transcript_21679/g.32138 Transcript_21679/m.32138 type:complete len:100 (-) Transcript_21679:826-1125(-)
MFAAYPIRSQSKSPPHTLILISLFSSQSLLLWIFRKSMNRIGSFIGFSLSNVFLNIVGSSVNTVLLCYAAAPFEFHQNHHLLSNEMKDSWNERWSDNFV